MFQVVILSLEVHCETDTAEQGIKQAKEVFKDRITRFGVDYVIGLLDSKVSRNYVSKADIPASPKFRVIKEEIKQCKSTK